VIAQSKIHWTNKSVKALSGEKNPIEVISAKVNDAILTAIENGWEGPPYDPFSLAEKMKIEVKPSNSVLEARILALSENKYLIEYNPGQPKKRIRFSIAHEISHTLFPDCQEQIRHRNQEADTDKDNWQLETLCNIAASEFLLPFGSLSSEAQTENISIDNIIDLREKFQVSTEAILLRLIRLTDNPHIVFTASARSGSKYQLDYAVGSTEKLNKIKLAIPADSAIKECVAIGYTAKNKEIWNTELGQCVVEAVGIPPYPGQIIPRIAGIIKPISVVADAPLHIEYLHGDAITPRNGDARIIAQVVNDSTSTWGGRGFAPQVAQRIPGVQAEFQTWSTSNRENLRLGNNHTIRCQGNSYLVSMIAQHGYGASLTPRIRYQALPACLRQLARKANEMRLPVHMPKIGTGEAGGRWEVIEDLIHQEIIEKNIPVTVFLWDRIKGKSPLQGELF